jgi:uridine kinase
MVIIITGASHVGKTLLAQKTPEQTIRTKLRISVIPSENFAAKDPFRSCLMKCSGLTAAKEAK